MSFIKPPVPVSYLENEAVGEVIGEVAGLTIGSDESHETEDGNQFPAELTIYSKLSLTRTLVLSGLAIGSDGFDSSSNGNLSLIFLEFYILISLWVCTRASNAFIIGTIRAKEWCGLHRFDIGGGSCNESDQKGYNMIRGPYGRNILRR
jgi:hypothetical protein